MEHNEHDAKPPNARESGQDIVGEAQSEDDVVGPDVASGSDQSAESRVPPAALTTRKVGASSEDSGSPENAGAAEDTVAPNGAAATNSAGPGTRIELPTELDISPATQPPVALGDRHSHLLPFDGSEGSESESNPVDQIFPPEWRLPADSSGSFHAPESAAADESPETLGKTMPRVQVLVTLLQSKTMYAEAIDEAFAKHASKYRQIAETEVDRGFWHYENQRRAADWRLRGP